MDYRTRDIACAIQKQMAAMHMLMRNLQTIHGEVTEPAKAISSAVLAMDKVFKDMHSNACLSHVAALDERELALLAKRMKKASKELIKLLQE